MHHSVPELHVFFCDTFVTEHVPRESGETDTEFQECSVSVHRTLEHPAILHPCVVFGNLKSPYLIDRSVEYFVGSDAADTLPPLPLGLRLEFWDFGEEFSLVSRFVTPFVQSFRVYLESVGHTLHTLGLP